MTQAISLYFLNTAYSSAPQILPQLMCLPPEILAIILSNIGINTILNICRISQTCKSIRNPLLSTIPYVESLEIYHDKILDLFTGVKHLNIYDEYVGIRSFSKNIWGNLKSLTICENVCSFLYESKYFLDIGYLERNPRNSESIQQYPRNSESIQQYLELIYLMPRLTILHIYGVHQLSRSLSKPYSICRDVVPNLKVLKLKECEIYNLLEFKDIESLELSKAYGINTKVLNNLNIRKLYMNLEYPNVNWYELNMPNLRCLTLKNMKISFDKLSNLKIEELTLDSIRFVDSRNIQKMNNLITLVLINIGRVSDNISSKIFPVLKNLRIEVCSNINISVSSLVDIVIEGCMNIVIAGYLYKFVRNKSLVFQHGSDNYISRYED